MLFSCKNTAFGYWPGMLFIFGRRRLSVNSGGNMLTIKELDEFEQALKSGRIEADFEFGNEQQRYDILELLQKLMDVADTADEVASKIIYRGLQKPREA